MRFGNIAYYVIDGRERPALPLITPRCLPVTLGATRHTGNYLRVSIWPLGPVFDTVCGSKNDHEKKQARRQQFKPPRKGEKAVPGRPVAGDDTAFLYQRPGRA